MALATADDILRLGSVLGRDGHVVASRLFPQIEDPWKKLGTVAGANVVANELGKGLINRTILTFTARDVEMLDEAGVAAYGGSAVYDFPAGLIHVFGCVANLSVLKSGAGINANFDGDFSVGTTTADNDASLATTEQDIIPSTATPQASSGATTAKGYNVAAIAPLDGTVTPVSLFLNFLIDDADQDITGGGASSLLVSGLLIFHWVNLGDL